LSVVACVVDYTKHYAPKGISVVLQVKASTYTS